MKHARISITSLAGAALLIAAGALPAAASVIVLETEFVQRVQTAPGIFDESDDRHVPLRPYEACFGWRMVVEPTDASVRVREVLTLRGPAQRWDHGPETNVSDDRRSAVTERDVTPLDGRLTGIWCVTEGDPPGPARFEIELDGSPVETIDFELVPEGGPVS